MEIKLEQVLDNCNGLRPKVLKITLNWTPQNYPELNYQRQSDDPSKPPTVDEFFLKKKKDT